MWDNGCVNYINGGLLSQCICISNYGYTWNILQFLKFSLNEIFKNYFSCTIILKAHY